MSNGIFDFGPKKLDMPGNPNDGKRYGFIFSTERAVDFGHWSEEGTYRNVPANVAETMNRQHGTEIIQERCAFLVVHYKDDVDIEAYLTDIEDKQQVDGDVALGYDKNGPNGGRWINAKSLTPVLGIATKPLDKRYENVIAFINTKSKE